MQIFFLTFLSFNFACGTFLHVKIFDFSLHKIVSLFFYFWVIAIKTLLLSLSSSIVSFQFWSLSIWPAWNSSWYKGQNMNLLSFLLQIMLVVMATCTVVAVSCLPSSSLPRLHSQCPCMWKTCSVPVPRLQHTFRRVELPSFPQCVSSC